MHRSLREKKPSELRMRKVLYFSSVTYRQMHALARANQISPSSVIAIAVARFFRAEQNRHSKTALRAASRAGDNGASEET